MTGYVLLFAIVLGVNLLPAFGPPTWSVIVLYGLNSDLPMFGLVLTAAIAAASGRYLLATAFAHLRRRAPARMQENAAAARDLFERRRRNAIVAIALFVFSPLPSAQLFEAAGLAGLRLARFTIAFFAGRFVSYSLYAASARGIRLYVAREDLIGAMTGLPGIAVQIAMIGGIVLLARVDWVAMLARASESNSTPQD